MNKHLTHQDRESIERLCNELWAVCSNWADDEFRASTDGESAYRCFGLAMAELSYNLQVASLVDVPEGAGNWSSTELANLNRRKNQLLSAI